MATPLTLPARERGLLKETRILAVALAGGVLAAAAAAQSPSPSRARRRPRRLRRPPPSPIVPDVQFEEALPPLDPALYEPLDRDRPRGAGLSACSRPGRGCAARRSRAGRAAAAALHASTSSRSRTPPRPTRKARTARRSATPWSSTAWRRSISKAASAACPRSRMREGEAVNGAMIAARAEEDEALAVRLLRSEGYYDAVADLRDRAASRAGRAAARHHHRRAGQPLQLRRRSAIAGPDTVPPGIAARGAAR